MSCPFIYYLDSVYVCERLNIPNENRVNFLQQEKRTVPGKNAEEAARFSQLSRQLCALVRFTGETVHIRLITSSSKAPWASPLLHGVADDACTALNDCVVNQYPQLESVLKVFKEEEE